MSLKNNTLHIAWVSFTQTIVLRQSTKKKKKINDASISLTQFKPNWSQNFSSANRRTNKFEGKRQNDKRTVRIQRTQLVRLVIVKGFFGTQKKKMCRRGCSTAGETHLFCATKKCLSFLWLNKEAGKTLSLFPPLSQYVCVAYCRVEWT